MKREKNGTERYFADQYFEIVFRERNEEILYDNEELKFVAS